MNDCWNKAPGDRPTISQVISGLTAQTLHMSWVQPAQVELRSPTSPDGALAESDITFLTSLVSHFSFYDFGFVLMLSELSAGH